MYERYINRKPLPSEINEGVNELVITDVSRGYPVSCGEELIINGEDRYTVISASADDITVLPTKTQYPGPR